MASRSISTPARRRRRRRVEASRENPDRLGRSEDYPGFQHDACLIAGLPGLAEAEARRDAVGVHERQLIADEEDALLVGWGQRERKRRTGRAVENVGRAGGEAAGRSDIFPPPRQADILVEL